MMSNEGGKPTKQIEMKPHPKIMDEMADFLKQKGHCCVSIVGWDDHKFDWCQKDECEKAKIRKAMRHEQDTQEAFIKHLEDTGHTCISIGERYPVCVHWCNQPTCTNQK